MFQFAVLHDVHIDLGDSSKVCPKRTFDRTIMDTALEYTPQIPLLQSINKIRMALEVVWFSDISSADGRFIDRHWTRNNLSTPTRNRYTWPLLHAVTRRDWMAWKRWIRSICQNDEYRLINPLGAWICNEE
jgi:hypothetical protein